MFSSMSFVPDLHTHVPSPKEGGEYFYHSSFVISLSDRASLPSSICSSHFLILSPLVCGSHINGTVYSMYPFVYGLFRSTYCF